MKINILGTEYKITVKTYASAPLLKKLGWVGYCDQELKEIILLDLDKEEEWKDEIKAKKEAVHKSTLRHEIVHAFLNESGLCDDANQYGAAWSKNEEMVDWFAVQAPKIFKIYKELNIL